MQSQSLHTFSKVATPHEVHDLEMLRALIPLQHGGIAGIGKILNNDFLARYSQKEPVPGVVTVNVLRSNSSPLS